MFDTLVAAQGPAIDRRARRALISASIVVHAAALAAAMVMAWWNVDKLEVDDPPVHAALSIPGSPPPGGGEARKPLVPKKVRKVTPDEPVQPTITPIVTEPDEGGGAQTTGVGPGEGDGPPDGTGTGECTDPSCVGTEPVKKDPPPEEPKQVVVTRPVTIAPNVASGLRVSGNDQIHAPDPVRTAMIRDGKTQTMGVVKLCLDARGRVSSASMLRSTGYDAYDRTILGEVRAWRYEPYRVEGDAVPACTVVNFVYRIKR